MDWKVLLDLIVNLAAGLIGFWIGWIWQKGKKLIGFRKARHFWKPFADGKLRVIIGRFLEFKSFEESGFVGLGCAIGLTELSAYFEEVGLKEFTVSYADRLDGDDLKTNLVLLGGPDANAVTREVIPRISSELQLGNPTNYEISIYDSQTTKMYAPSRSPLTNEIDKDYAVIIRAENPFAPTKQILLIAGSYGYGTWAGVRFAISKQFLDNSIVAENKSLECLIETDIVRETPQDIRLIILRSLEGNKS
jgi:hypothetical protein